MTTLKPSTIAFLMILAMTVFVWALRGFAVLTFLPGSILWVLMGLCLIAAVISVWR